MKEILIGTTNPSKANYFAWLLSGYDLRFHTLKDLDITAEPEETGNTPEENAILKARFYGQFFDLVLCNDSGLYLDCLPLSDPRYRNSGIRQAGRILSGRHAISQKTRGMAAGFHFPIQRFHDLLCGRP